MKKPRLTKAEKAANVPAPSPEKPMPTAIVVAEKAHSTLGASIAKRWMNCPGSVALVARCPEQGTSVHAAEGTAAHALAELALRKGVDPDMWLGLTVEGVEVSEDMVENVRVYVEHCRELVAQHSGEMRLEHRFSLGSLNPPAPMFGTADFTLYAAHEKTLYVRDLKFGKGVIVEVADNKQLKYYGLGAVLSPEFKGLDIQWIDIGIVQPRASHKDGLIRSEKVSLMELLEFTEDLMDAARATQAPNAPLKVGDHCTFCPAMAVCPAQLEYAQATAQQEFSVIPASEISLPTPASLTKEQLAVLLEKFEIVEDWMGSVRAFAQNELNQGREVPGYKLVQKKAIRKWLNEDDAAQVIGAMGVPADQLFETSLRSPAQIEKIVGKKQFPKELVIQKSSGTTMVPASDARPAVMSGEEFSLLPTAATPQDN